MRQRPADKVERKAVSSLVPYAKNARTHSEEQVAQIAASIREWGWTVPVLVDDDDGIIAGHGRILAADRLGLSDVPCMVATDWTEALIRAGRALIRWRLSRPNRGLDALFMPVLLLSQCRRRRPRPRYPSNTAAQCPLA